MQHTAWRVYALRNKCAELLQRFYFPYFDESFKSMTVMQMDIRDTLKEEVKEAGKIRKSIYGILQQKQPEHAPSPQGAGYGAITDRAAGLSASAPPPCFAF